MAEEIPQLVDLDLNPVSNKSVQNHEATQQSAAQVDTASNDVENEAGSKKRIPATILTGFLGSGKTTLLNYILNENHGKRIAVIMNEFGDSQGVDKSLVTKNDKGDTVEEWLDLDNGCLCCTVKDKGIKAIETLMEKRGKFDYILLETTGVADPGRIAGMFWTNEEFDSDIYLDGIVTLVDAKNFKKELNKPNHTRDKDSPSEIQNQIALADRIIINKLDLVSEEQLHNVEDIIRNMNQVAQIKTSIYSKIDLDFVLSIGAYSDPSALLISKIQDLKETSKKDTSRPNSTDSTIKTICFEYPPSPNPNTPNNDNNVTNVVEWNKIDEWIQILLWENQIPGTTSANNNNNNNNNSNDQEQQQQQQQQQQQESEAMEILRIKGVLKVKNFFEVGSPQPSDDSQSHIMVQGVREIYEATKIDASVTPSDQLPNKLILIGRNMDHEGLKNSWLTLISSN
ncbi:hypothetical protein H4219_002936 [Mycoemilia scoparia]|uniref:Uncharacterized protein n=1 Tax=Mycoemilia scoparia TaxID=417184 RepID=A0A9W7ZWZ6_9FUNG|nr:hypothetical protein H4219_002936 [Mycoemilia scoparia]